MFLLSCLAAPTAKMLRLSVAPTGASPQLAPYAHFHRRMLTRGEQTEPGAPHPPISWAREASRRLCRASNGQLLSGLVAVAKHGQRPLQLLDLHLRLVGLLLSALVALLEALHLALHHLLGTPRFCHHSSSCSACVASCSARSAVSPSYSLSPSSP